MLSGFNSMMEALYHGVPMVGYGFFADQVRFFLIDLRG